MKENIITDDNINKLVHNFYAKVRIDNQLGPIFAAVISNDDTKWKSHLQRMVDFWSSIMLASGRYHGNPFKKHKDLPPFNVTLFDRWLELFAETAQEIYDQEIAEHYIEKSRRIAESLKLGLYYKTENTNTALETPILDKKNYSKQSRQVN